MTPPEFARRLDDALLEALTPLCGDLAFRGVDKIRSVLLANGEQGWRDFGGVITSEPMSGRAPRVLIIEMEETT